MKHLRLVHLGTGVSRALALGLAAALSMLPLASACGSTFEPVGPGGECFLATDCQPGLICIEQPDKTRICSDDLSRVAGRPPPEGGADEGDGGDGGVPEASPGDVTQPPEDSGAPDANEPPPDSGAPSEEAGAD